MNMFLKRLYMKEITATSLKYENKLKISSVKYNGF